MKRYKIRKDLLGKEFLVCTENGKYNYKIYNRPLKGIVREIYENSEGDVDVLLEVSTPNQCSGTFEWFPAKSLMTQEEFDFLRATQAL